VGLETIQSDCSQTGLAVLTNLESKNTRLIQYKTQSPVEDYIRKFIVTELTYENQNFAIVTTHLSWKLDDDASREKQADELSNYMSEVNAPGVLTGDFNCEYLSKPMTSIQNDYASLLKDRPDENKPTWDNKNPMVQWHKDRYPDRKLDQILVNPAFEKLFTCKDCYITCTKPNANGITPSDHYGLLALFK